MATLKLVWLTCEGLAAGESLILTPFFSNAPVSSPSGPAIVTVSGSNQVLFQPETKIDFFRISSFIYLHTSDGAIFFSEDYIWDTENASQATPFGLIVDPTGTRSNLRPVIHYDLTASAVAASMR
jgi:hypothetical protein